MNSGRVLSIAVISLVTVTLRAQSPKLYINLATHNEMNEEYYDSIESQYTTAKSVSLQILNKVNSIGAKWNFQTCSKFVLGALKWDAAATSSSDLLETLYASGNVEIDPRNKIEPPRYSFNISDVYHLLDSCGVTSTHTVGGFICYPYESEDWTQFRNPKIGAVYGEPWQAEIIWGGGSFNHVADANNYGVWKPRAGDSEQNFYDHDENANLWLVGNGCAPVIRDSTLDVQWIVNLIRDNVSKLKNGNWPADKFYSLTVMTNVKDFDSPGYFAKVRTVLDSIQTYVNEGYMEWATISTKLSLFEQWSQDNAIAYSQWTCEEASAAASLSEVQKQELVLFPNPVADLLYVKTPGLKKAYVVHDISGKRIVEGEINELNSSISFDKLNAGVYFVTLEIGTYKVIKE